MNDNKTSLNNNQTAMNSIPIAAVLAFCAVSAAAAQESKSATEADLPAGAAKQIVATTCTGGHDLSRIVSANHFAAEWRDIRAQSLQIEPIGALTFWWSMIFSENRIPLLRIML